MKKSKASKGAKMDFGLDMNFGNMEQEVYGNVEEDEELMAELMALERREQQATQRASAVSRQKPTNQLRNSELDPSHLAAALADPKLPDLPDDALESDPTLLDELGALLGSGSTEEPAPGPEPARVAPPVPSRTAPSAPSSSAPMARVEALAAHYTKMHKQAEAAGESAKARRHKRALDKLADIRKQIARGQAVAEDEWPVAPPGMTVPGSTSVASDGPPPVPKRNASAQPASGKREEIRGILLRRRDLYVARGKEAVAAKDKTSAVKFVAASKQFDQALVTLDSVPESDLNIEDIPPSPPPFSASASSSAPPLPPRNTAPAPTPEEAPPPPPDVPLGNNGKAERIKAILQRRKEANVRNGKEAMAAGDKSAATGFMTAAKQFQEALKALEEADASEIDEADIPPSPKPYKKAPTTFEGCLLWRREVFADLVAKNKSKGEERKVRMNQRMVGQYDEALREFKAGRKVDVDELPTLPHFPPLPPQTAGAPSGAGPSKPASGASAAPGPSGPNPRVHVPETGPFAKTGTAGESRNQASLEFLLKQQAEFKRAAVHAKNAGNVELAKKYLVDAKGFESMIKAAQAGLPVSIKNCPVPPQQHTSSAALQPRIVPQGASDTGLEKRGEVLAMLEKVLIGQIQSAEANRMRFTRLGDVGRVRTFEEWAGTARKDLLLIREVAKQGIRLPQFHYEVRQIPNADLFPHLAEDVLELHIHNANQVPLPSGYDATSASLFCKYEFPYPAEGKQTGKTKLVAGTVSPEFEEAFMIQIGTRKARGLKLMRTIKRTPLRIEVYQKGGFLRSDKLLGVAEIKLDHLEGRAEVEECAPLKEGRKAVGGSLRVRIRVREPLGDAKVAMKSEKWLILDN